MSDTISMQVRSITLEADGILAFDLRPVRPAELPAFTAGAHVDLVLGKDLIRPYSLTNDPAERHRYVVAVTRDAEGRGGSRHMHDTLRVGDILAVHPPRNNFELVEDAEETVLVAGGIGITPLLSMIQRLEALGRRWSLHFSARSETAAAFRERLAGYGDRVSYYFSNDPDSARLDIGALVKRHPAAHFYCCGPQRMLDAFESATRGIGPRGHLERFGASQEIAAEGNFSIVLAKTGQTFQIPEGKTILEVLLEAGVDVAFSCEQGICGACETTVLAGIPEHRDEVLNAEDRAANKKIMICCSRAKSQTLVLDL